MVVVLVLSLSFLLSYLHATDDDEPIVIIVIAAAAALTSLLNLASS